MRPLRDALIVTLDGCRDHRACSTDDTLRLYRTEHLARADTLLYGRLPCEMMEAVWRAPARAGVKPDWMEPWMEPFPG